MTRRYLIVLALAGSACGHPARGGASLLPAGMGGVWQRESLHVIPPLNSGIARGFEAVYRGTGKLTVELYETKAPGTAFEMVQHWRAAPNTVVFDKGRYFVRVEWEQADRQALTAFVRALQKVLDE
jgi:hypothetical protein